MLNCGEGVNIPVLKGGDHLVSFRGLVVVPISVFSNISLIQHLSCSIRDYEIMHWDYLNVDFSPMDGGDGNSLDSRDNVDLRSLQIVEGGLPFKNSMHKKSKSKKK